MNMSTTIHPPQLQEHDHKVQWGNLPQTAQSLSIAQFSKQHSGCNLIITSNIHEANRLHRELKFFINDDSFPRLHFPDWETLAFDHFSPHEDITSQRLATLHKLGQLKHAIIIAALPTLLQRTIPQSYLDAHVFLLKTGDTLHINVLMQRLTAAGYHRVDQVRQHGEIAIRGSIIDIFPSGSQIPFRIELFDDEVETIREFDPETQLSNQTIDSIELLPAREYPLTDEAITQFRQSFRSQFEGNPKDCPIYEAISGGHAFPGSEYYLPLFFNSLSTFFDYLPADTHLFLPDQFNEKITECWREINHRYEQLRYDLTRPLCKPQQLYLSADDLFSALKPYKQIRVTHEQLADKPGCYNFDAVALPDLSIAIKSKQPLARLAQFLDDFQGKVLITAESGGRRETLLDTLSQIQLKPTAVPDWHHFLSTTDLQNLTIAPLDYGFILQDTQIAVIPESALFGEQVMQRRMRKRETQDAVNMIRNLSELKIGDAVVHIQYGIGRYLGLETITTGDVSAEYLTLAYADNDKIYVPINGLHQISRYSSVDAEYTQLNKLGSNRWSKTKAQAIKQIRDVAAELLKIYSERAATPGHAFKKPGSDYQHFRQAFPFEETPDQATTIDSVINDMIKPTSMDRLVCGDVGFGKTEVAMQAAFHAANQGKQVAILAPTTLLAEQHYNNFKDRFADWPIQIGLLSRLQTKKNQDDTLAKLKRGFVDIVIGTHKLLSDDIEFKDLGLLIVDEEHRFGVQQKEKIRKLRASVDLLSLTATPIPRSLNMSLSGMRDLSLISTPPVRRLSVKTFLYENNDSIIREAITREIMRGGQVYYLHNDVATIAATADKIKAIIPNAKVDFAHGQMRERQLERVMSDFYHQRFNVLVCTTIVESGIDIPSANTIIIDRADKFGLAQLHQLRGRVGRSHHQAYAYLMVPDKKAITKDAEKRLEAITTFEDLGAGFILATHDLEIRGAGELLGENQSGHIEAIGFTLYMEMLDEAVEALKEGKDLQLDLGNSKPQVDVDLHVSSLLPNDYVHDISIRLSLYKRLSNCKNSEDIQQFKAELIDRFGLLPIEAQHLLSATRLKLIAKSLGITKVDLHEQFGYIHFSQSSNIDVAKLVRLVQTQPKQYQLQGQTKLRIHFNDPDTNKRINETEALLVNLS